MSGEHKYIVAQVEGEERIFVFPKVIDHDRMWESLEAIRFGSDRNWERKLREEGNVFNIRNKADLGSWMEEVVEPRGPRSQPSPTTPQGADNPIA
mgnify:CR=1 FL=1